MAGNDFECPGGLQPNMTEIQSGEVIHGSASVSWISDLFISKEDRIALYQEVEKATVGRSLLASAKSTDAEAIDAINNMLIDKPTLLPAAVQFLKRKVKDKDPRIGLIALDAVDLLMQKHGPPVQYEVMNKVLQRILKMSIPTTRISTPEEIALRKRAGHNCTNVLNFLLYDLEFCSSMADTQVGYIEGKGRSSR